MSRAPLVTVIGLRGIGLTAAVLLAAVGVEVVAVDPDARTRHDRAIPPDGGVDPDAGIRFADRIPPAAVHLLALPTPPPDLAPVLRDGDLLCTLTGPGLSGTLQLAEGICASRPDLGLDITGGGPVLHVAHLIARAGPDDAVDLAHGAHRVEGASGTAAVLAAALLSRICHGPLDLVVPAWSGPERVAEWSAPA